ncbi:hypothetical protein Btru_022770 [Bulinus truncatus]|nr:hypothetical protein Btru_022770 [Bulinus truncatus]
MSLSKDVSYFICKCKNLESLQQCIETGVWACQDRISPPHPEDLLTNAHEKGSVILIYSVNNQHGWHGYAQSMYNLSLDEIENNEHKAVCCTNDTISSTITSQITTDPTQATISVTGENFKQQQPADIEEENKLTFSNENLNFNNASKKYHFFRILWLKHFLKYNRQECLHFKSTDNLLLFDGTPVNKARNWQQVNEDIGKKICTLIDQHYDHLNLMQELKKEARLSLNNESFFKHEEAKITLENTGWNYAVEKVKKELGKVHLVCPFGSQRYNCSVADSDQDIFIVYQARTIQMLSLDPPRQTIKNSEKKSVDYTVLELQRYCDLLLAGDQKCVETLFLIDTEATYFASPEWKELDNIREGLLTRSCFEKYLREAQGNNGLKQITKWKLGNPESEELPPKINKLAYVCLRLLQNAREIMKLGTLKVFRTNDSIEWKELHDIRSGKYNYSNLMNLLTRYLTEMDEHRDCGLHDNLVEVKHLIESWLIKCRLQDLHLNPYSPQ